MVNPGIFMKRTGLFRMGALGMGFLISAMLISLVINPALASNLNSEHSSNDIQLTENDDNTRSENNIWYIYLLKEIIDNRTFDRPIIINSSGELRIRNNAIFEIAQNYDFQRNITVKDNGTLRLRKGSLSSNRQLSIKLEDNGKLILENGSNLEVKRITALEKTMVQISQSIIGPGIGGLSITMNGESSLDLIGSTIESADLVAARDESTIKIKNSEIQSTRFDISCREITITSNKVFRDLKVDRIEYCYIFGSTVRNIEVGSCGFMRISQGSELIDCTLNDIKELDIQKATLTNIDIKEVDSTLTIRDSKNISNVFVHNCTTLEIKNSHIKDFQLDHFSYSIVIQNSVIESSSILPKNINIFNSEFKCSRTQLDTLTRASVFNAHNTSFNDYLKFSGTSVAELVNCSTSDDEPSDTKDLPEVKVYNDAKVHIFWWLDVYVVDAQEQPISGATVTIYDFIYNNQVISARSDVLGKIRFKLLGNTITSQGWSSSENNSYFMKGKYDKYATEDNAGIFMEENKVVTLKFDNVNKKKEEEKPIISNDVLIGILIIIVIVILIGVSLSSRSKRNKNNDYVPKTDPRRTKTAKTRRSQRNGQNQFKPEDKLRKEMGPRKF